MESFEEWRDRVLAAWDRIAPSYVRAQQRPLDGHLRLLWDHGATVEQIAEALEVSFASKHHTKRQALGYAYNLAWTQIGGQDA